MTRSPGLVLRSVEVDGATVDVVIRDGVIRAIGTASSEDRRLPVLNGAGGALLPGLWDHHLHLLAMAAAIRSVTVGPPEVADLPSMAAALATMDRRLGTGEWIRAVGYHESVAGDLDRRALDRLVPDRPLRVQHRSGALWILNSDACARVGLDAATEIEVDRDAGGEPTGRLLGADTWLRARLPESEPDLRLVGDSLTRMGITGVTDATPDEDPGSWDVIASAHRAGALPQRVVVMGGPALAARSAPAPLGRGPVKIYLADHDLPGLEAVTADVATAHDAGRPVAFHSVTRSSLVLAIAALDVVGAHPGDRIEHGAVVPPELVERLADLSATVVTQPGFVCERGDRYLAEVDSDDQPFLYPCASLLAHGVAVAGSSDAPFGHHDPWRAMAAAIERRTSAGASIVRAEAVDPARALGLYLGTADAPGGPPRQVAVGAPADLCLLEAPLAEALREPSADLVAATVIDGDVFPVRGQR